MVASFSKSSNCQGSMTLLQITLNWKHKQVIATLNLSGKILRIAIGNSCCIKTTIMRLQANQLEIVEGYKALDVWRVSLWHFYISQTLTKTSLLCCWHVWHAKGRYVRRPYDIGCNCSHIPMSTRFWRLFKPSFVLPLMLRRVPIKLSHTFFLTCITSIQWRTCRSN